MAHELRGTVLKREAEEEARHAKGLLTESYS
jgi:hypothetical protein